MSITRLQQARQMYATGQRVSRAFGGVIGSDGRRQYGGGSDTGAVSSGYQGGGRDEKGNVSGSAPGAGSSHNSNTPSGADDRSSDTQQYNHYEATNQYNPMKEDMLPGDVPDGFIKPEDATNLGLNLRPYEQQRVDFLNTPYKPLNIPPFIPGGMFINTVGNFLGGIGAKKNRQFFADNVAGKYGFGYGMDAYKDYMRQRMAGEVGAYGNENMGQNAIDARARDGGGGIMDVYTDNTTDDTTDDTTTEDELLLRFLGEDSTLDPAAAGVANTDELRAMILERAKNLYT